ncbi:hypothetical protein ACFLQN_02105 [Candidatus Aenigmatarchaeota archaeon]
MDTTMSDFQTLFQERLERRREIRDRARRISSKKRQRQIREAAEVGFEYAKNAGRVGGVLAAAGVLAVQPLIELGSVIGNYNGVEDNTGVPSPLPTRRVDAPVGEGYDWLQINGNGFSVIPDIAQEINVIDAPYRFDDLIPKTDPLSEPRYKPYEIDTFAQRLAPYDRAFNLHSSLPDIDESLLRAIASRESSALPDTTNGDDLGLMGIRKLGALMHIYRIFNPPTITDTNTGKRIKDPHWVNLRNDPRYSVSLTELEPYFSNQHGVWWEKAKRNAMIGEVSVGVGAVYLQHIFDNSSGRDEAVARYRMGPANYDSSGTTVVVRSYVNDVIALDKAFSRSG